MIHPLQFQALIVVVRILVIDSALETQDPGLGTQDPYVGPMIRHSLSGTWVPEGHGTPKFLSETRDPGPGTLELGR